MLLTKKVKIVKFGNKNVKYYSDLGYDTSLPEFEVDVSDLTKGSKYEIIAKCDFCGSEVSKKYYLYLKNISSNGLFACSSKCGKHKTKMTNLDRFGFEYAVQSEEVRSKTVKTNLERWGFESPMKSEAVKDKMKNTNMEKWGVEFTLSSKEVRNKIKETTIEKYGVDHNLKSPEVRRKIKETLIKNFGVDNPSKSEEIKIAKKKTSMENWGVEYPSKSDEVKSRVKKTNIERLGVEYPMQSEEVRKKSKSKLAEKYGVSHNSQIQEVKDKMKAKNLENWGVEYTLQSKSIRERIKNTILEKWNCKSALQNEDFRLSYFKIAKDTEYLRYEGEKISSFWCENGKHEFKISSINYHSRTKIKSKLCTVCYPIESSKSIKENEMRDFISSNYKGEIISSYRDVFEIDIYLPELAIGFEFNGIYWHSEKHVDKNYHIEKTMHFEQKGIKIMHIWEDDWDSKKEIVKSMLMNKIGKSEKIWARKCIVREVAKIESGIFLEKNHIQGKCNNLVSIGLFHDGEMAALMTFNRYEGRKIMKEGEWNLSRFCNRLNTNIVGGASKLLSYFIKTHRPSRIVSYADRDWSVGDVYHQLGFDMVSESRPDYKYVVDGKRKNKQNFKKSNIGIGDETTESAHMQKIGINKIWDCGKIKFEFKNKDRAD